MILWSRDWDYLWLSMILWSRDWVQSRTQINILSVWSLESAGNNQDCNLCWHFQEKVKTKRCVGLIWCVNTALTVDLTTLARDIWLAWPISVQLLDINQKSKFIARGGLSGGAQYYVSLSGPRPGYQDLTGLSPYCNSKLLDININQGQEDCVWRSSILPCLSLRAGLVPSLTWMIEHCLAQQKM